MQIHWTGWANFPQMNTLEHPPSISTFISLRRVYAATHMYSERIFVDGPDTAHGRQSEIRYHGLWRNKNSPGSPVMYIDDIRKTRKHSAVFFSCFHFGSTFRLRVELSAESTSGVQVGDSWFRLYDLNFGPLGESQFSGRTDAHHVEPEYT
jgi:hypothetical protein